MKYPWYKKINPLWWFCNSNDSITSDNHPLFHPTKPLWIRKILWGIRNPLHNLFFFVIGLSDQPDVVNYSGQWPKEGQKWNIILPFISYKGKKWEYYFGWRKGICLGAAFRRVNSKPM